MEFVMGKGKMSNWREKLWEKVVDNLPEKEGILLGAGVGTGKNIQYYPDDIEIYAIDFSENMLHKAKKKAKYHKKILTF